MSVQREIKFRVWDRFEERFLSVQEMHSYNISPIDGHLLFIDGHDCDARYYLNQYTGLKDKNGKEIYEGDIVKFNPEDNSFIDIYPEECGNGGLDRSEVKFGGGCFYFDAQYGAEGLEIPFENTEVIGNIYENPELLDENNI